MGGNHPKHLGPAAPAPLPGRRRHVVLAAVVVTVVVALALSWRLDQRGPGAAAELAAGVSPPSTPPSGSSSGSSSPTTTARAAPRAVTLAFAGDMNFEGVNAQRLANDPASLLDAMAPVLSRADLAIGNLETALGTGGTAWPGKEFTFRAPAKALDALRAAGLDVVSMANNHGMDFGAAGLQESLAIKRAQADGFVIGIGADEDEAYAPFMADVHGQVIAVLGATQVISNSMIEAWTATATQPGLASAKRVDRLVEEVVAARAVADTVVVFLHWGVELDTCPTQDQKSLAATLANAGADLIIGGHAHRVQGAGRLGDALVGYGLGNFLWNARSPESATTGVLQVTVTGRRVDSYTWVPGRIDNGSPHPLAGPEAAAAVARWDGLRACTGLQP